MDTAVKHPVPDQVKPLFVTLGWASECPDVKNYKWRRNPVWHRILYSFKYLKLSSFSMTCLTGMLTNA